MKTSRRSVLGHLAAFGAALVAMVVPSRARAAGEIKLDFADPGTVLGQSLTISKAIEELNAIACKEDGRGDFFWGYSSNHTVESRGYYYSIWRVVRKPGQAISGSFQFHGPFGAALKHIESLRKDRTEIVEPNPRLQIMFSQDVTLIPASSGDEQDHSPYVAIGGQRSLFIQVNALRHIDSQEVRSFTRFYDWESQDSKFQGQLQLIALREYEITDKEYDSLTSMIDVMMSGDIFPPPPPERKNELITVRSMD